MDKQIIITIIIIGFCVILVSMNLMKPKTREYMTVEEELSLTDIDIEALQNLSSMYNSSTQTLNVANIAATGTATLTNLAVTGNATSTGTTTVKDLAVTGNATVAGTTKTNGGIWSDYYVINAKGYSYADLGKYAGWMTGANPSATGVIYSSDKGKLGFKVGSNYYLTTQGTANMINFTGNTGDYYTGQGVVQ